MVVDVRPGRALTALVCVAVLAGLGHRTLDQASYWRDDLSLWRHGVEVSPDSAISHTNLADAYARRGPEAFVPAERHYLIALQLNPRSAIALDHLARIYEMQGRNAEAIRLYVRALAIDPTRLQATLSLGELLAEAGRGAEAVAVWRTGLGHHPDSLRLLDALADILATFPIRRFATATLRSSWRIRQARPAGTATPTHWSGSPRHWPRTDVSSKP